MMANNYAELSGHLARALIDFVHGAAVQGGRVRIDHVGREQADEIFEGAAAMASDPAELSGVHVLVEEKHLPHHVTYEQAVELRNRLESRLILLVPEGIGMAGSSLDNSFSKRKFSELVRFAIRNLRSGLGEDADLNSVLVRLEKLSRLPDDSLDTLSFLDAIRPERSVSWGEELWRVGLIPDFGDGAIERLNKNNLASREIASPAARASSIDSRLGKLQLVDSPARVKLSHFLSQRPLHEPKSWASELVQDGFRDLSFDNWLFSSDTNVSLVDLELTPFINRKGIPQSWSGLTSQDDDLLVLPMRGSNEDSMSGTIGVRWKTQPKTVDGLGGFRLEVVPVQLAIELGADDSPVAETAVGPASRSAKVKIDLSPEQSGLGNRFCVRLSALDADGQPAVLSSTDRDSNLTAVITSDEFKVEITGFEPDVYEREATADSITAARLEQNLDGDEAKWPEKLAWDDDAQLLSVRFGDSRAYSVRYSTPLKQLENSCTADLSSATSFRLATDGLETLSLENVEVQKWKLPRALITARKKLFDQLGVDSSESGIRSLIAANWDATAIDLAMSYLATYRRALESSEGDELLGLLVMDTLSMEMPTGKGPLQAAVVLPSHPLRLGWVATYEQLMQEWGQAAAGEEVSRARKTVETDLSSRIAPANLPYIQIDSAGKAFVYHSELTFGSGFYVPVGAHDVESTVSLALSVLNLPKRVQDGGNAVQMLSRKINEYREVHTLDSGFLSFNALNPGDGATLAAGLDSALSVYGSEESTVSDMRIRVATFASRISATDPVRRLRETQEAYSALPSGKKSSFLVPPFSLAALSMDELDKMPSGHLGVIQGLSGIGVSRVPIPPRASLLRGLISPLQVAALEGGPDSQGVAVLATLSSSPNSPGNEIPQAHQAHQLATSRKMELGDGAPGLSMHITEEMAEGIRIIHEKSDWVVTLDRNVGATTFEELLRPLLPDSVLLDYAPEFVDGFSERVSVTTTHRGEINLALAQGMSELGLQAVNRGPAEIVKTLTDISGRLVLRLYKPNSLAREAVGLAAAMTYLESKGALEDTIVVPIDAHPEIFAPGRRGTEENALRCDLMLIRLTRRSFKVELVEVKARKAMHKPDGSLNEHIENQLVATKNFLGERVLPVGGSRVDAELQWVRATSLLHFYADRAAYAGRLSPQRLDEMHNLIARLGENPVEPQYTLTGYVVTLDSGGTDHKVARPNANIYYLTADRLEGIGFTTEFGPTPTQ